MGIQASKKRHYDPTGRRRTNTKGDGTVLPVKALGFLDKRLCIGQQFFFMLRLNAGWERCRMSAASESVPQSANTVNCRSSYSSIIFLSFLIFCNSNGRFIVLFYYSTIIPGVWKQEAFQSYFLSFLYKVLPKPMKEC